MTAPRRAAEEGRNKQDLLLANPVFRHLQKSKLDSMPRFSTYSSACGTELPFLAVLLLRLWGNSHSGYFRMAKTSESSHAVINFSKILVAISVFLLTLPVLALF